MNIPSNYRLIIFVYQYSTCVESLKNCPASKQADQVTDFLKTDIENYCNNTIENAGVTVLYTMQEMHVL